MIMRIACFFGPAFPDVGAARLFAHGDKLLVADDLLGFGIDGRTGRLDPDPSQGLLRPEVRRLRGGQPRGISADRPAGPDAHRPVDPCPPFPRPHGHARPPQPAADSRAITESSTGNLNLTRPWRRVSPRAREQTKALWRPLPDHHQSMPSLPRPLRSAALRLRRILIAAALFAASPGAKLGLLTRQRVRLRMRRVRRRHRKPVS